MDRFRRNHQGVLVPRAQRRKKSEQLVGMICRGSAILLFLLLLFYLFGNGGIEDNAMFRIGTTNLREGSETTKLTTISKLKDPVGRKNVPRPRWRARNGGGRGLAAGEEPKKKLTLTKTGT